MPNQGCTADDPSIRCFDWQNIELFGLMCESSHYHGEEWSHIALYFLFLQRLLANKWMCKNNPMSLFTFSYFFKDFWQTYGCVQFRIYCSLTVLFKNYDHLCQNVSWINNLCWVWFILEHPHCRMFTFRLICIHPGFIICVDVIQNFWCTTMIFFSISLQQATWAFLSSIM